MPTLVERSTPADARRDWVGEGGEVDGRKGERERALPIGDVLGEPAGRGPAAYDVA